MIYRILAAPPGYPPQCNYMVAAYQTLEYDSCVGNVRRRLPFESEHQFLELWESGGTNQ